MSLLWADSFENYTAGGDRTALDPVYDYDSLLSTSAAGLTTGRTGSKAAYLENPLTASSVVYGHELDVSGLSTDATWIVGMAIYLDDNNFEGGNQSRRVSLLQFRDSAGDEQVTVYINAGNLNVVSGGATSSTKLGLATAMLLTKVWHFIELKLTFNATSGAVELRVDDQQVLSTAGVTAPTASGELYPSTIVLSGSYENTRIRMDDLYICDGAGSVNNDFLGDVGIKRLDMTADGTHSDFTPSSGTDHFALVDEEDPDGDTSYVESGTSGHKDSFAVENLATTPAEIHALQVVATGKSDDGGAVSGRHVVLSGGSEGTGPTYALTADYVPRQSIHETDPDTAAAWTAAGVDAAEVGVEVV